MKTLHILIITLVLPLILMFCQTGCRARELNVQKAKSAELRKEDLRIGNWQSSALNGSRHIELRDSGGQYVRLRIFPLDTIIFSLQEGFKGRASSVELEGFTQYLQKVDDSRVFTAGHQDVVQVDQQSTVSSKDKTSSKYRVNRSIPVFSGLLLLGLLVVVVWLWRRYSK